MSMSLRVNMSTGNICHLPLPATLQHLGGRGLIAKMLCAEMDPRADALGPHNVLIVCNGMLAGTGAPCSGRLSVGAKSPLTGTIKEANAGGTFGIALARQHLRALVIEGKSPKNILQILVIDQNGARLENGAACQQLGTYATCEILREKYGQTISILTVGTAGEWGYLNSSLQVTDPQGHPSRAAARGGLGAVMASKGLKAIVIAQDRLEKKPLANPSIFRAALKVYLKGLREHPLTGKVFPHFGTAMLMGVINEMGALPTNNYREGRFAQAEALSGETLAKYQQERNGQTRHACQPGCPIGCSNVYNDAQGAYLTSGLEYETLALNGSNLGIGDLDLVANIDRLCDDAGLDSMETGVTIGVAMEAGLIAFGDSIGVLDLVRQMVMGTALGRELGQGAERFGKGRHVRRIPTIKGQGLAGYDPRALKGTGVTCATSPMGADHTAGNTLGHPGLNPLSSEGQVEASRATQQVMAVFDTLGMCIFAGIPAADPDLFAQVGFMLEGAFGEPWPAERLMSLGIECLESERLFNHWAGVEAASDDVPAFMRTEQLAPHASVFDIAPQALQTLFPPVQKKY